MMTKSPCIKECLLEDNVCVSCFRTCDEISFWTRYSDAEKLQVLATIEVRKRGSQNETNPKDPA